MGEFLLMLMSLEIKTKLQVSKLSYKILRQRNVVPQGERRFNPWGSIFHGLSAGKLYKPSTSPPFLPKTLIRARVLSKVARHRKY